MRVVACYKSVPDEQDVKVNADKTLSYAGAEFKVGAYDLNAVEAGLRLAPDGEVYVLTAGGASVDNSKLKKAILSRGPAAMYGVMDASLEGADSYATAAVLKAAVEKIGGVDLLLCGEGSGDIYAQQTGSMLGAMLGWNTLNAVSAVFMEGDKLKVDRSLDNSVELLEVSMPAVLSVTSDINVPRIPGMKEILAAGKKPMTVWSLTDIGAAVENRTETLSILAPEQADRKKIVIEGDGDAEIDMLYNHLRKLG